MFSQLKAGPQAIQADTSTRMAKPYAMRVYQPDCLILGNSRAEVGYRASELPGCERPYNAAVANGHLYEARRHLQHALALGPVRQVLLALDLETFTSLELTAPGFNEQRLAVNAKGEAQLFPAGELVGLALGYDATQRSLKLRMQKPLLAAISADGDRNPESLQQIAEMNSSRDLEQRMLEQFAFIGTLLMNGPVFNLDTGRGAAAMAEYQKILALCADHNVSLRVVINPQHATLHDYLRHLGLQSAYIEWKHRLAAKTAAAAVTQDVQLWDFGKLNALTTEKFDLHQTGSMMAGYLEPSHFRAVIGDRVLRQVFAGQSSGIDNFGERLTDASVGDDAGYLRAVAAWSAANPEIDAAVAKMAKNAQGQKD
ncbi:MAG: hypothetical protein V4607_14905 [Pseudomonadota bacterium]